jgi:hypothetical protein
LAVFGGGHPVSWNPLDAALVPAIRTCGGTLQVGDGLEEEVGSHLRFAVAWIGVAPALDIENETSLERGFGLAAMDVDIFLGVRCFIATFF